MLAFFKQAVFDWAINYFGKYAALCKGEALPCLPHLERHRLTQQPVAADIRLTAERKVTDFYQESLFFRGPLSLPGLTRDVIVMLLTQESSFTDL